MVVMVAVVVMVVVMVVVLNITSLVQTLSSASSVVLLKLSALIMTPPGQTDRQRQCVLNLFDSLSVHPSVTKLVKTIF